jgi:hypothetical protein
MNVTQAADDWPVPRLRLTHIAVVLLAGTALVGALGVEHAHREGAIMFSLDAEQNLPSAWSGLLLAFAALGAVMLSRTAPPGGRWLWWSLAGVLAFLAVDEVVSGHERLGDLARVDWQIPFAPFAIFAAGVCLVALRRLWRERRSLGLLFAAGGACWLASQGLELVQWDGEAKVPEYFTLMVVEEILEMLGSICFGLSLFALVFAPAVRTDHRAPRVPRAALNH